MPKYRKPQGRSVRPTFFVFCEGETEEEYVSFLRSHFRVPKYKKGHIDKTLREILAEKMDTATERAAALTTHGNPSTDVPQFIAALKEQ